MSRMLDRGETLTAIAELAGVKVSEVRAVLKSAGAQPVAPPDALGAASAATDAPQRARRTVGGRAGRRRGARGRCRWDCLTWQRARRGCGGGAVGRSRGARRGMPTLRFLRGAGPAVDDCDFFIGAIGTDGYGRFFIYRSGQAGSVCGRTATR